MSIERVVLVRVAITTADQRQLVKDLLAAHERATDAAPGDRTDVIRYETLSTQLESLGRNAWVSNGAEYLPLQAGSQDGHSFYSDRNIDRLPPAAAQADEWIKAGDLAVELRLPFIVGATPASTDQRHTVTEPQDIWRATDSRGRELHNAAAVSARFSQQVAAAVRGAEGAAILPSGINNRALTETMRDYALAVSGVHPVDVPVRYQDGSYGPAFPARCTSFSDIVPAGWSSYHFAMLSIRHTELDAVVDGAWLRNAEISQNRPHGDTDRIAYEQSIEQFRQLTAAGPAVVYLYQTGLQPAVMGIYRAVVHHLIEQPGTLAVVPMYFVQNDSDGAGRLVGSYRQQSIFEESRRPWAT